MVSQSPTDKGPYPLSMSVHIGERKTHTLTGVQWWRQVGWLGQTGAVYGPDDNPYAEPGGFVPLWILIEDELPPPPDKARSTMDGK